MGTVELDRQVIERRDFPIVRRGYDPASVDAHLRALAADVEELRLRSAEPREEIRSQLWPARRCKVFWRRLRRRPRRSSARPPRRPRLRGPRPTLTRVVSATRRSRALRSGGGGLTGD